MRADLPAEAQVSGLRALWQEAFGDDDAFLDTFFRTAYSPDRCLCISIDGDVAAALYWFDCRCDGAPMAYIYAVATAKMHRGKGLCTALMTDAHTLLQKRGYAGSILVPGEKGLFSMYEKLGYTCFGGMDTFSCEAGTPAPMKKITAAEYAALRSSYLPSRGVEQTGLDFLACYATFYAGDDFILAATEDTGLELLGNAAAAPGIVAALSKKSGNFRISGNAPFAMYHPLSDTPAPAYFGLAFD